MNNIRLVFNSFFRWLQRKKVILRNPVDGLEPIKYKQAVKKPLSPEELEKVRRACEQERDLAIVEFLYSSAVRVSELCRLNRDDICWESDDVMVLGKGNKEREVYLNACLLYTSHDSVANRDVLIFVGQDAEGEWIPPIEEREVQYLHNIAVRVSSTDKITFDVSVSDFVRKDYLDQKLEEHMRHSGHIFVGAADTEIREGDVLLIMDIGGEPPVPDGDFVVAAPTNLVISCLLYTSRCV